MSRRSPSECRFDDCRHDSEPGCAVQAAVRQGELGQERLASFRKLASELRRPRRHGRQGGRPSEPMIET